MILALDAHLDLIALVIVILGGIFAIQRGFTDRWRSQFEALEREYKQYKVKMANQHAEDQLERDALHERATSLETATHDLEQKMAAMPDLQSVQTVLMATSTKLEQGHEVIIENEGVLMRANQYQREEHAKMIEALEDITKRLEQIITEH